ncbi:hypothetical protein G5714_001154 [Onychostoma macrolepis]|uniref:Uncharacterized protein n=1 Tax=Onychostoma macrolepis TaxID=369639 RepID=A0A7J6DIE0_9TELE|nr:hypothetical protein G5714_001154 [Onychostoma macrolepis]
MIADDDESASTELSSTTPSRAYGDMLDVMDHAIKRLDLAWTHEKPKPAHGRLDEHFLAGLDRPVPGSLPFLPDLHSEISKSWGKSYSFRLHPFQHTDYANVEGVAERRYTRVPPFEEMFARYLSQAKGMIGLELRLANRASPPSRSQQGKPTANKGKKEC